MIASHLAFEKLSKLGSKHTML
uniref:M-lycotoxin-Ls4a n=1 Tax=Lycosa singoriensis TaxID=434756 RepID=LYC40_LYCSI|nr:RecName: Full=M-lycotoxin-Ls4a; Short=M-LCTX-Ls4a; AltName: Full=Peptide 2340 [Lycosa singoriensis]